MSRHRWLPLAAAVVGLAACGQAASDSKNGRGSPSTVTGLSSPPGGADEFVEFEEVARGMRRIADRDLAVAMNADELIELLHANRASLFGSVDFRTRVVAVFTHPIEDCGIQLDGLERDGRVLTALFEPSPDECPATTAPLPEPWWEDVWFIAVDRVALTPSFTLRLPADPNTGAAELRLDVDVPSVDALPPPPTFETVAVETSADRPGVLRAAIDGHQLQRLWASARLPGSPPAVDFSRQVVIAVTIYGSGSCVDEFAGFDVSDQRVWTPLWQRPEGICTSDAVPRTYVVAVDREAATPGFTLRLLYGMLDEGGGERRLQVDVPASADDPPTDASVVSAPVNSSTTTTTWPTSAAPTLPTSPRSAPPPSTPPTRMDRVDTIDGPLLRSAFDNGDEMDAVVQGTLAIEGDCLVLQERDPTGTVTASFPVVWPANTRWQPDPPNVVLNNGGLIPLGAKISGGGGYLPVEIVAAMAGEAVAEAAAGCIGPTGEIAFFNAGAAVEIEPD